MNLSTSLNPRISPAPIAVPTATFGAIYLSLLRPDGTGPQRLGRMHAAATEYTPDVPGSATAMEQLLSQILGQQVRLSTQQLGAFKRLVTSPAFAALSPWKRQVQTRELPEMVSASNLYDIYLALLKPDGGMMKRFKAVQSAIAMYEPGVPGSQGALEQELSRLIGKSVQLSEVQLRCFKELLIDEPAFAHIAPWEDLTASW